MEIVKNATAGTLESSDIFIAVEPHDCLEVEIQSVVEAQYGSAIRSAILDVLEEFQIRTGKITANDRGALDCVIRARMEAAILRGGGEKS